MANTTITSNIDIKDFQSLSSVNKLDNILLSLFGGGSAKISVELLTAVLVRTVKPTIVDNIWHIGGISTEVVANGKTPVLRTSAAGIEWQYEGDGTWQLLVGYDTLKLKFSDLTPEQVQSLKLKFSDLAESEIAELQRPALRAAEKIGELEVVISDNEESRVQQETGRITKESARASAEESRSETFDTLKLSSEQATTLATEVATHQSYVGEDNYVYQWNIVTKEFDKTDIYVKGDEGKSGVQLGGEVLDSTNFYIPDDVVDVDITAYEYAVKGGYKGSEAQFGIEQAAIAGNSVRLANVEQNKQDKPIAGRTFLTPLFVTLGIVFNDSTGFYEYNGLVNITEQQALAIYVPSLGIQGGDWSSVFMGSNARTAVVKDHLNSTVNPSECFRGALIEVINFTNTRSNYSINFTTGYLMFHTATSLKTILGFIKCDLIKTTGFMFTGCLSLELVKLHKLSVSITFIDSPKLLRESVLYLVNNSANTTPITVTLHPTAKARLTEEDIALAVSKNITIA